MRPAIVEIRDRLLAHDSAELSLDLIGEIIGDEAISADEIEELFLALEKSGRSIGSNTPNVREHLGIVIRNARQLHRASQETPDIAAIARASGLAPGAVRTALLYASVLSREK